MIFDSTHNRQLPGLPPIVTGSQIRFGNPGNSSYESMEEQLASYLQKAHEADTRLVLDWEADDALKRLDPTRSDAATTNEAMSQAIEMLDFCLSFSPGVPVGFYGACLPVATNYNEIYLDEEKWRRSLEQLQSIQDGRTVSRYGLIDRLDWLHPAYYMPAFWRDNYLTSSSVRKKSEVVIAAGARACRDWSKTHAPYVWPSSWKSAAAFGEFLEMVLTHSDHVIIWDHRSISDATLSAIRLFKEKV